MVWVGRRLLHLAFFTAALAIAPQAATPQSLLPNSGYCQDVLAKTPAASGELFSSEWTAQRRSNFLAGLFESTGISLSPQSLVQNRLTLAEAQKIVAPNFQAARQGMRNALLAGKKILVLNGSFDLVHGGHAAMVQASLHNFMVSQKLKREEVFLVILADADSLIFSSKKHKWSELGGSEPLPRPLQSLTNIKGSTYELHPRVIDLANLGADLVALTPSPGDFIEESQQPWFSGFLNRANVLNWQLRKERELTQNSYSPEQTAEIHLVFETAIRMFSALKEGRSQDILSDFEAAAPGQFLPLWHVSSWQMILQYSLELDEFLPGSVHKVLNFRDSEYLHNVASWSRAVGQVVSFIDGTDIFYSTSELLKTFNIEELVALKQELYPKQ